MAGSCDLTIDAKLTTSCRRVARPLTSSREGPGARVELRRAGTLSPGRRGRAKRWGATGSGVSSIVGQLCVNSPSTLGQLCVKGGRVYFAAWNMQPASATVETLA